MGWTGMNAESRRNGGKGPVLVLHKLGPGLQCTILAKIQHSATAEMPFAMRKKYILQDFTIWQ